jgi:uncharacterized ParB-like nuclease family protein
LTIACLECGSVTNEQTPEFSGTTSELSEPQPVHVKIYSGTYQTELTAEPEGGVWSATPSNALEPGTYTAIAEQESSLDNETGKSESIVFTIDTTPPQLTLTFPSNGSATTSSSETVGGAAGTASKDLPTITVQLFSGASIGSAPPLEAVSVQASGGAWSATFGGLAVGTYTVRARQYDKAGNKTTTAPATFTVSAVPAPLISPPTASFTWIPSVPHAGQTVTLISSSSDTFAPITALAWSTTSPERFVPGGPLFTTSFAAPGAYPLQLRVTDANGRASVAAHTIQVAPAPLLLMQPFPVVRIVGTLTSSGAAIKLLSVLAPLASRVSVNCHGHGCPVRSESHIASAGKKHIHGGVVLLTFRRFARVLRSGVVLEIRVSKAGQIGKYTRFAIHRHSLPTRVDECLNPSTLKPITCPT